MTSASQPESGSASAGPDSHVWAKLRPGEKSDKLWIKCRRFRERAPLKAYATELQDCPYCAALPNQLCRTKSGRVAFYHAERIEAGIKYLRERLRNVSTRART